MRGGLPDYRIWESLLEGSRAIASDLEGFTAHVYAEVLQEVRTNVFKLSVTPLHASRVR